VVVAWLSSLTNVINQVHIVDVAKVFAEHGILVLSSVLNSNIATLASI